MNSTLHQAAVDVGQPETEPVLGIAPEVIFAGFGDCEKICQELCLSYAFFSQGWVGAAVSFVTFLGVPASVIGGLSVADEIELHEAPARYYTRLVLVVFVILRNEGSRLLNHLLRFFAKAAQNDRMPAQNDKVFVILNGVKDLALSPLDSSQKSSE